MFFRFKYTLMLMIVVIAIMVWVYFPINRESFGGWMSKEDESLQLTCIVAGEHGNKYCVRDRTKKKQAAALLAKVANQCRLFVDKLFVKFPENPICIQLNENFDEHKITETLPNSEYTAFSENKGEKIAFCLTPKKDSDDEGLIDEHTLTFVAIHELTHVGTASVGHGDEFWSNFKFMLEQAKEFGIHEPVDYKKNPAKYCSMQIKDNPIFDWHK